MKIKKFKDWKMFYKVITVAATPIIIFALTFVFYLIPEISDSIYGFKKNSLQNNIDIAYSISQHYYDEASLGKITEDEAKTKALQDIKSLRYEKTNYFWINDVQPKMIMHPIKPQLDGKDLSNNKDPDGKKLFVEMVDVAKKSGNGFVNYKWSKPGSDIPVNKISYIKLFKPWGWIIGTGMYVDDVEQQLSSISNTLILFLLLASIIIGFIGYGIAKMITLPLNKIANVAESLSNGDTSLSLNIDTKDEIGDLGRSFSTLIESTKVKIAAVKKMAKGELENVKLASDVDELGIEYNKQVEIIRKLVAETNLLIEEAKKGNLSARADAREFEGAWQNLLNGINSLIEEIVIPIQKGSDVLAVMATGDLTAKVEGEFKGDHAKLVNSINILGDSLNALVTEITEAVNSVASASAQISSSVQELSVGTQEQTNQTHEIASAMEEMSSTIIETTQNASRAAEASQSAGNIAKNGGVVVENTIKGMGDISDVVEKAAETVKILGKNSEEIGAIISVINDIADQTNLLALNAAIEAARAGEQGRGFAVVADEVRKLAERTTKATKEIAAMIDKIQLDTESAVASMDKGTEKVEKGRELTQKAGKVLEQIIDASSSVLDVVAQVAAASEQQSSASAEISNAITNISNITQETMQGSQQIAEATEDLNRMAVKLENMVSHFIIRNDSLQIRNDS